MSPVDLILNIWTWKPARFVYKSDLVATHIHIAPGGWNLQSTSWTTPRHHLGLPPETIRNDLQRPTNQDYIQKNSEITSTDNSDISRKIILNYLQTLSGITSRPSGDYLRRPFWVTSYLELVKVKWLNQSTGNSSCQTNTRMPSPSWLLSASDTYSRTFNVKQLGDF